MMSSSMPVRSLLWRTIFLILVTTIIVEPVSSSSDVVNSSPNARRLVPRQFQSSLNHRRSDLPAGGASVKGAAFTPQSTVVVEYDYADAFSHSSSNIDDRYPTTGTTPRAIVSFDASQTHPIVVMNTFDAHLLSVECSSPPVTLAVAEAAASARSRTINLEFNSRDLADEAWDTWSPYNLDPSSNFHLVTSHSGSGCNLEGELGAWRVHEVVRPSSSLQDHDRKTIYLLAVPIALHELGVYNVMLSGHIMSGTWDPHRLNDNGVERLERRKTFNSAVDEDKSGTEILSGDVSFNLPPEIQDKVDSANLHVNCIECTFSFNFTVDVNLTMSALNVTALSVTTTVVDFDQKVLLGVSTGVSGLTLQYTRDVFNIPLLALGLRDLVNIGPEVGVSAEVDFDISGAVNYTTGAKASIPSGAWATFDFISMSGSDKGWDTAHFEAIPLRLYSGDLNSTTTTAISPFIGIGVTLPINDNQPLVGVRITQNTPSIAFTANVSNHVNRNCEPVGDSDFESFSTAYSLSADMLFGTHVGLVGDLAFVLPPWDEVFPHGDFPLLNQSSVGSGKECYVVVDDDGTKTATLTAAPTGTLLVAASAVPSFDVSKIESYYSANGHLPTNVNYYQLAEVTAVPDNIKDQVQKAAQSDAPKSGAVKVRFGFGLGTWVVLYAVGLVFTGLV